MATKATVYKVELEISDIDRGYYASHSLTLAQHPSENDRRLMARVIAFALYAHERLEFGRGLSTPDDSDLCQRDLTGMIELWIDLGQPDEAGVRKACSLAKQVVLLTYSGNSADVWWTKNEAQFARLRNLSVVDLDSSELESATHLLERRLQLQVMIQEGICQLIKGNETAQITPRIRMAAAR